MGAVVALPVQGAVMLARAAALTARAVAVVARILVKASIHAIKALVPIMRKAAVAALKIAVKASRVIAKAAGKVATFARKAMRAAAPHIRKFIFFTQKKVLLIGKKMGKILKTWGSKLSRHAKELVKRMSNGLRRARTTRRHNRSRTSYSRHLGGDDPMGSKDQATINAAVEDAGNVIEHRVEGVWNVNITMPSFGNLCSTLADLIARPIPRTLIMTWWLEFQEEVFRTNGFGTWDIGDEGYRQRKEKKGGGSKPMQWGENGGGRLFRSFLDPSSKDFSTTTTGGELSIRTLVPWAAVLANGQQELDSSPSPIDFLQSERFSQFLKPRLDLYGKEVLNLTDSLVKGISPKVVIT